MSPRIVAALAAKATVTTVVLASAVLASSAALAPGTAQASATATHSLSDKPMSGVQSVIGCLSTKLCIVGGYTEKSVGDIVPVHSGVPGKAQTVRHTSDMYSISCPNPSGCIALARPSNDIGALIVKIGSSGKVLSAKNYSVPAGASLSRIACTTLTSCVVTGNDVFTSPITMEVGTWNGSKVTLHKVSPPHGASDPIISGLSCASTSCYAVGFADKGTDGVGLLLPISKGKAGKLTSVTGEALAAIACISKTRCYVGGYNRTSGLIWTLAGGKLSAPKTAPPDLLTIACAGPLCTAAGTNGLNGTITTVSGGTPGSTQTDATSGGFSDIARKHNVFVAVGPKLHGESEVTSG